MEENNGTAVGDFGTILRTTDGGDSWTPQTSGTTKTLYGVSFTDANNGTICGFDLGGGSQIILRTTDGGNNWVEQKNYSLPQARTLSTPYPSPMQTLERSLARPA